MNIKENVQESASKIRKIFFGLLNSAFCETELHPLTLKRMYLSFYLKLCMAVNCGAMFGSQIFSL